MTIDPDTISFLKWLGGGALTLLSGALALVGKGLSAILRMQEGTTKACVEQTESNKLVAAALNRLPCAQGRLDINSHTSRIAILPNKPGE